jgi:hypothetical protein
MDYSELQDRLKVALGKISKYDILLQSPFDAFSLINMVSEEEKNECTKVFWDTHRSWMHRNGIDSRLLGLMLVDNKGRQREHHVFSEFIVPYLKKPDLVIPDNWKSILGQILTSKVQIAGVMKESDENYFPNLKREKSAASFLDLSVFLALKKGILRWFKKSGHIFKRVFFFSSVFC